MATATPIIDLKNVAAAVREPWKPIIVAELNGQHVKIARLEGSFIWHTHEQEDEMFLVLEGVLEMHYRDRVITIHEGQACVVPRGVEHKPIAQPMATVLLFEPATTVNTGDVAGDHRTLQPEDLQRL